MQRERPTMFAAGKKNAERETKNQDGLRAGGRIGKAESLPNYFYSLFREEKGPLWKDVFRLAELPDAVEGPKILNAYAAVGLDGINWAVVKPLEGHTGRIPSGAV